MSGWTAKRFWTEASAAEVPGGWTVRLDDRPVKTPAKAPLMVPTRALAAALADEWQAQSGKIDPGSMPLTRMANSAIDKVAPQFDAVAAMLAGYGGTDLLCYRADGPVALVARQGAAWDPLLAWVAGQGAPLTVTTGVIPVPQPPASLAALHAQVAAFTPFGLAALHDLVAISGSLVLGLAATAGRVTPQDAFALSRIDEDWQAEIWGHDEEAVESAALKRAALLDAGRFYALLA